MPQRTAQNLHTAT